MVVNRIIKFRKLALSSFSVRRVLTYTLTTFLIGSLGFFYGKQRANSTKSFFEKSDESSPMNLQSLKKELELCLMNEAWTESPRSERYGLSEFGIGSPFFEGAEVQFQNFSYKRAIIEKRVIQVQTENKSIPIISITTWQLRQSSEYLPELPERLKDSKQQTHLTYDLNDFPVFDGYEFQTKVSPDKFVSSRIPEYSPASSVYVSEKGIRMYRSKIVCPRPHCGAQLHFLDTIHNGKTLVFVQVSSEIRNPSSELIEEQSVLRQAFRETEKVADTISLALF